ncbi:MAG: hypothetical protein ACI8VI_001705, partial [Granulosicoccus sp.]
QQKRITLSFVLLSQQMTLSGARHGFTDGRDKHNE